MVERFARVRYRAIVVLLTCALGLLYVGYQSVQGERGLLGWVERSAEVERTRAEVAVLADERAKLERRVSQLRTDNLDLDLLDQEARRLLNLGRPDEEVLFHDRPSHSPAPNERRIATPGVGHTLPIADISVVMASIWLPPLVRLPHLT